MEKYQTGSGVSWIARAVHIESTEDYLDVYMWRARCYSKCEGQPKFKITWYYLGDYHVDSQGVTSKTGFEPISVLRCEHETTLKFSTYVQ